MWHLWVEIVLETTTANKQKQQKKNKNWKIRNVVHSMYSYTLNVRSKQCEPSNATRQISFEKIVELISLVARSRTAITILIRQI